jgi:hypothetical protein
MQPQILPSRKQRSSQ